MNLSSIVRVSVIECGAYIISGDRSVGRHEPKSHISREMPCLSASATWSREMSSFEIFTVIVTPGKVLES